MSIFVRMKLILLTLIMTNAMAPKISFPYAYIKNGSRFSCIALDASADISCTKGRTYRGKNEGHCWNLNLCANDSPKCPLSCTKILEHKKSPLQRYCLDTYGDLACYHQTSLPPPIRFNCARKTPSLF